MTDDLDSLRTAVDAVDDRLLAALHQRAALCRSVGDLKRARGLPVLDPAREAAVVERVGAFARGHGLPEDDLRALYRRLLAMMRRVQLE